MTLMSALRQRISAIAARSRQIPIRQPADTEPMVELDQQGQPAMRGQGFLRPFQCESENRLSSYADDKVFFCLPHNSFFCFRVPHVREIRFTIHGC
jgi:hypothetical protein